MKPDRNAQQEMTNVAFGIRSELEDISTSKEYIEGYLKGIEVALLDLGFEPGVAREVSDRLREFRNEAIRCAGVQRSDPK